MIFENKNAVFKVINSMYYSDSNAKMHISGRTFCALSFRVKSDTDILSKGKKLHVQDGDITFFPINISYDRISKDDELIAIHFEIFNDATDRICVYSPKNSGEFEKLFREIIPITQAGAPGATYRANAVLNTIFAKIFEEKQMDEAHSEKFLIAKKYIDENYSNPLLSISEIAIYCNLSEGYLRRLFKKELSISPKKYLNYVRMQHAASLINSGFYKISEVSEIVGFYDPKYFSQAYKKFSASSPKNYFTQKCLTLR